MVVRLEACWCEMSLLNCVGGVGVWVRGWSGCVGEWVRGLKICVGAWVKTFFAWVKNYFAWVRTFFAWVEIFAWVDFFCVG